MENSQEKTCDGVHFLKSCRLRACNITLSLPKIFKTTTLLWVYRKVWEQRFYRTHTGWLCNYQGFCWHPSKHSPWWRHLEDVLKTSFVFVFTWRFEGVFKTSWSKVIYLWSDCNWTRTQNHLVLKGTLKHLAKLAKWLSCVLSTYLYGAFDCMFLSCHVCVSEWIQTL